jgi:hypothetical protein
MCCKLLEVAPLNKPRATWCTHCDQKHGCNIYADRPGACRSFHCGYLRLAVLDERWKPSKAKFLINYEDQANRIAIHVDPARPGAWRVAPYYATIKQWSERAFAERRMVIVWSAEHAIVVLPDRDVDLGLVRDDQFIVPVQRMTARGPMVDFEVADADDSRVKSR